MISFFFFFLAESLPTQIVVNVHGVGYHVLIPLSSFERLPQPGAPLKWRYDPPQDEAAQGVGGHASNDRERPERGSTDTLPNQGCTGGG